MILVNENSSMRTGTNKQPPSPTLLSVVPSTWKTTFREQIRRVRRLCITVDLTGNWKISQGAIAEILEVLKLAENLINLEIAIAEPRYASTTSPLFLIQHTALMPFLRLEYPGMKKSTITMTNIPRHFERSFSKYVRSNDWTGTYIVGQTESHVRAFLG